MIFLSFAATSLAAGNAYRFAPDPKGVIAIDEPVDAAPAAGADGVAYLAAVDQVLLTGPQPVWHRHISYRVIHERGLGNAGRIELEFQPAYQRLEIHALDVWRDGKRIDQRASARIDVLRREQGLESGLLDGSLTVNITLPGLRVSDRISYRASVIGFNPVFGSAYHDSYAAAFSVPVALRLVRFVHPDAMSLHWKAPAKGFDVRQHAEGDHRVLEVEARNVPGVSDETDTPASYMPYGRIEVSTAGGWQDVADWAAPLYPGSFTQRQRVAGVLDGLNLDSADPEGSALRATAFVQGDIRYTGLDMGVNSHAPNRPETVLERRYGDCKDKAILLMALLNEAGIRAQPVLVHTKHHATVQGRLASPLAFNHVVVRARVAEREVWIDPTWTRERGAFETRTALPYRKGLVLAAGEKALVDIPWPPPPAPQVEVEQTITLSSQDRETTAAFEVGTHYRQGYADNVRRDFDTEGAEQVGKGYLRYMQGFYDGIRAEGDPAAQDREAEYRVDERYILRWDPEKEGSVFGIVFFQVLDWMPAIADEPRQAPLVLKGPRHGRQTIRTKHSDGWSIAPETERVETRYFRFTREISIKDDMLVITADWQRLTDEVPAADVRALREDVKKVRDLLQYNIDMDPDIPFSSLRASDWVRPMLVMAGTVLALLLAWLMRKRFALAGIFFRPRAAVSGVLARGGLMGIGAVLLVVSVLIDAVFELGTRMAAGLSGIMLVGIAIGAIIGLSLRWLLWGGLVQLSFRLLGHRLRYAEVLGASGWATAPTCLLFVAALAATGLDFSLFADSTALAPPQWPGLIVAVPLIVAGVVWMCVAMVGSYAALAGVRHRRALAATAMALLGLLVIVVPFALLFYLAKG